MPNLRYDFGRARCSVFHSYANEMVMVFFFPTVNSRDSFMIVLLCLEMNHTEGDHICDCETTA